MKRIYRNSGTGLITYETTQYDGNPVIPLVTLAPDDKRIVRMFGDSTQRGNTTDGSVALYAKPYINAWADSTVLDNEGVGGTYSLQLYEGGDGVHIYPWMKQLYCSPYNVVVLRYGINDTLVYSTANFKAVMRSLIVEAHANGKRVILQNPNPCNIVARPDLTNLVDRAVAVNELADEYQQTVLIDNWTSLVGLGTAASQTVDGVHPNALSYQRQAAWFENGMRVLCGLPIEQVGP